MMLLAGDGGVWTSFYMDPFNFQDLNLGLGNFSSSSRTLDRLLLVAALWSTSGQACPSVQVKTSVYQSPVPLIVKSSGVVADVKYFSGSWQYIAFFFLHLCIAHWLQNQTARRPVSQAEPGVLKSSLTCPPKDGGDPGRLSWERVSVSHSGMYSVSMTGFLHRSESRWRNSQKVA